MILDKDRFLAGVHVKLRPKKLKSQASLIIWIGETCVLNIRCNDLKFIYGKFTFNNPPLIPAKTEVRGLIVRDVGAAKGSAEFAMFLQHEHIIQASKQSVEK